MAKVTKTNMQAHLAEGAVSFSSTHKSEYSDPSYSIVVDTGEYARGRRKYVRTSLSYDEALFMFKSLAGFIVEGNNPDEIFAATAKLTSHEERLNKATEIVLKDIEDKKKAMDNRRG